MGRRLTLHQRLVADLKRCLCPYFAYAAFRSRPRAAASAGAAILSGSVSLVSLAASISLFSIRDLGVIAFM